MISPDTKDWTWVLDRMVRIVPVRRQHVPPRRRARADQGERRAVALLAGGGEDPTRPNGADDVVVDQYTCHVRDVYRRYTDRVELMRSIDDPLYPNWDQNASAVEDRYDLPEVDDPIHHVWDVSGAPFADCARVSP